ncbi:MAG: glycosyltransferase [Bacteroidetes bacterium]|nr:glycosyltransferase [Bacteroidota bacterium]MDA1119916.1 glycosyltransferase [Bacteroidota bacterium]
MITKEPLVSIICTCFNQEAFVSEALQSVVDQTYQSIEIIVIDDCSADSSYERIVSYANQNKIIKVVKNEINLGLCKNFNHGLKLSSGKYVIDFSCDDVLLPDRVKKQVRFFESLPSEIGVIFSNAEYIDENGKYHHHFYPPDHEGRAIEKPPSGDIYNQLIDRYFVSAPSMMMKREMLIQLGGYDEALAYEDFDFWIRSSREWKYAYQDEILTKVRITPGSLSGGYYHENDDQLMSTYEICQKIKTLNKTAEEDSALIRRLEYEIKHAVFADKRREADLMLQLLSEMQPLSLTQKFLSGLSKTSLKTGWIRDIVMKFRSRV